MAKAKPLDSEQKLELSPKSYFKFSYSPKSNLESSLNSTTRIEALITPSKFGIPSGGNLSAMVILESMMRKWAFLHLFHDKKRSLSFAGL